jgi:hypothetical protein
LANSVSGHFQEFRNDSSPPCKAHCSHVERVNFHKTSLFSHEHMLTINVDGNPSPFTTIGGDSSICFIKSTCNPLKNTTICYNLFKGNVLSNSTMTNVTFVLFSLFLTQSISFDYFNLGFPCREILIYDFEPKTPVGDMSIIGNNGTYAFNIYLVHNYAKELFFKETIKYEEYLLLIISIFATFSSVFLCFEGIKYCCVNCIFPVRLTIQERLKCVPDNLMFCGLIIFTIIGQLVFLGIFIENEIRTNFPVLSIKKVTPVFQIQNQIPRYYFCDQWNPLNSKNLCCDQVSCKTLQFQKNTNSFISHRFFSSNSQTIINGTLKSICINDYLVGSLNSYTTFNCFELNVNKLNRFYIRFQATLTPIDFIPIERFEIFQKILDCPKTPCETSIEFASSRFVLI